MYSTGNISVRNWDHLFQSRCIFMCTVWIWINQTTIISLQSINWLVWLSLGRASWYLSIAKPTRCASFSNLFYFCSSTLHVSDGLFVHHQESKTLHTASGVCHTDSAGCLLAGTKWNWVLDPWQRTERPSETCRVLLLLLLFPIALRPF
jgi:hypothetical protein